MGVTHFRGIAVTGSGLCVGEKNAETIVMNRSGQVQSGMLADSEAIVTPAGAVGGGTALKIDGGRHTCGSNVHRSISTALSSITTIVAQVDLPTAGGATWAYTSGRPHLVDTAFSGHCFDLWMTRVAGVLSGVVTSHYTSSFVNWIAVGT